MKKLFILLATLAFFSCSKTTSMQTADHASGSSVQDTLGHGIFLNTDAHQLSGEAYVYKSSNGSLILSIEKLSVLGGPDVDIFLSDSSAYSDVVRCGHLYGEDGEQITGTLTFPLKSDVDLSRYDHVIFWCKRYSVMFGYAKLN